MQKTKLAVKNAATYRGMEKRLGVIEMEYLALIRRQRELKMRILNAQAKIKAIRSTT